MMNLFKQIPGSILLYILVSILQFNLCLGSEVGVTQPVKMDEIMLTKTQNTDAPYFLSGKKMYEIGSMRGDYPRIGTHIPGEMGGIWAHPIKVMDGFSFEIEEGNDIWQLNNCQRFSHTFAYMDFYFEKDELSVNRRDFVVEDRPALFSSLIIKNEKDERKSLKLRFIGMFHIIPSWYSCYPDGNDRVECVDGKFMAYDTKMKTKWGVVVGGNVKPASCTIDGTKGILEYSFTLSPKQARKIDFLIVADHEKGYQEALSEFDSLMNNIDKLFSEKMNYYDEKISKGVAFDCSDPFFTKSFLYARANLVMLTADVSPSIGRYLFAGIPEYVQLFGCDTEYSIPGLMSVNFSDVAKDALKALARVGIRQGGRIPHEVTTSGNVYNPGNVEETPLFVIACWNYFKWTGDKEFLNDVYSLCKEGVFKYTLRFCDYDKDLYPEGNAMVERPGIGAEQVDSVCYLYEALHALAGMARTEGKIEEASKFDTLAKDIKKRFNEDWWIGRESLFADSLGYNNTQRSDGYWTQVIPMACRIADEDKGLKALRKIERERVNRWGLVHTKDVDNEVWTLPTGILAKAEFNYGNVEMGVKQLKNIAVTSEYGMPGSFKELIPEGMCFMQLWSSAFFLQGVVEGIFGIEPLANKDMVNIFPKLPKGWEYANIKAVRVGKHVMNISYKKHLKEETELIVSHVSGEKDLKCEISLFVSMDTFRIKANGSPILHYNVIDTYGKKVVRFKLILKPDQTIKIQVSS